MKKFLCGFFILLLLVDVAVQAQRDSIQLRKPEKRRWVRATSTGWYVFHSPDSDFTIEFPAKPRRDKDLQGEVMISRRYSYLGRSQWLSISFQDLGFPQDSRQANDLGSNIENIMITRTKERGGRTIRLQRLAKNILEEERWVPSKQSNGDRHIISRTIQRNSRMYTLGCVSVIDEQEVDKRMCRRFFSTFRIIGIPK